MKSKNSEKPLKFYSVSKKGDHLVIEVTGKSPLDITYKGEDKQGNLYQTRIVTDGKKSIKMGLEGFSPDGKKSQTDILIDPEESVKLDSKIFDPEGKPLKNISFNAPFSGNFSFVSEDYSAEALKAVLERSSAPSSKKISPSRLKRFSSSTKYFQRLESIMGEDGLIPTEKLNNVFENLNERRGAKMTLGLLSKSVPEAVKKVNNEGYKIIISDIFSQVAEAVGYVRTREQKTREPGPSSRDLSQEKRIETRKEIPVSKSEEFINHLEPFSNFASTQYISTLESMVKDDGTIKGSDIENTFRIPKIIGVKNALIKLTTLKSRPIEKTNGDYKVRDRDVFKKIRKVGEIKQAFGTFNAARYFVKMKEEGILSQTKDKVSIKEIEDLFGIKKQPALVSLSAINRTQKMRVEGTGKNRVYVFDPNVLTFDFSLGQTSSYETVVSTSQVNEKVPVNGEFREVASELKKMMWGSRSVTVRDFNQFCIERFGEGENLNEKREALRNRLLDNGYMVKVGKTKYALTEKLLKLV
ncbi:MAG: hypothetical protein GTN36_06210 [Candidatus Aenigmarchaeota archaeon]|nr:hypothetical protein [Candidatus Aenigmarchaeota archaeon]